MLNAERRCQNSLSLRCYPQGMRRRVRAGRALRGYSSDDSIRVRTLGQTSARVVLRGSSMSFNLDGQGGEGLKPVKSAWLQDVPMVAATAVAVLVATSLAVFAFLA
jgi:hypothetical protein